MGNALMWLAGFFLVLFVFSLNAYLGMAALCVAGFVGWTFFQEHQRLQQEIQKEAKERASQNQPRA